MLCYIIITVLNNRHTLLKFPNTNISIKMFIEQLEYEQNVFKMNLIQCVTLVKRKNNESLRVRN